MARFICVEAQIPAGVLGHNHCANTSRMSTQVHSSLSHYIPDLKRQHALSALRKLLRAPSGIDRRVRWKFA